MTYVVVLVAAAVVGLFVPPKGRVPVATIVWGGLVLLFATGIALVLGQQGDIPNLLLLKENPAAEFVWLVPTIGGGYGLLLGGLAAQVRQMLNRR